jgi:hypothetical protein
MFFPALAAIVTLVGGLGFLISSLAHASGAGDFIFNASAAFMVAGPLIFLGYVFIGLCLEFINLDRPPEVQRTAGVPLVEPAVAGPGPAVFEDWIPEGLLREHKGPLNRRTGRASKI